MEGLVKPLETIHILGVLEQINKVNYMIELHRLHDEVSMVKQFENQREGFLFELKILLATVGINAELQAVA
jgi:hypothetical protein